MCPEVQNNSTIAYSFRSLWRGYLLLRLRGGFRISPISSLFDLAIDRDDRTIRFGTRLASGNSNR